jgi:hypothetical protein
MYRTLGRRLLALVSAYALALNTLVAVVAVSPDTETVFPVICGFGNASQAPTDPASRHSVCPWPCAMAGCTAAALPGRNPGSVLALAWVVLGALAPSPDDAPPVFACPRGALARGPPIA